MCLAHYPYVPLDILMFPTLAILVILMCPVDDPYVPLAYPYLPCTGYSTLQPQPESACLLSASAWTFQSHFSLIQPVLALPDLYRRPYSTIRHFRSVPQLVQYFLDLILVPGTTRPPVPDVRAFVLLQYSTIGI